MRMATPPNLDQLGSDAARLLHQGKSDDARQLIDAATANGAELDYRCAWLLAQACRRLEQTDAEAAALHIVLRHASRDLGGLLAMGEVFVRKGDDRAAMSWFQLAIRQASLTPPPAQIIPMLQRAEAFCLQAQSRFTEHLNSEISRSGVAQAGSPAFKHALDLLTGQSQLYLQQPSMFYYPGLPQRTFYQRDEFAWSAAFEAGAEAMRDEYLALLAAGEPFAPYVARSLERPAPNNPLLEDLSWGAAYLWRDGSVTELGEQAPATITALADSGMPQIKRRSPMALYSRLRPGTHIAPHHGLLNTRLICHLPLVAPDGCELRVGQDTRAWCFGELLIFDDSIEHEAWNRGTSDRTILLFEIWRPEIPEADRAALATLFEAIDRIDPTLGQEQA